jgi:hypothetical protein
MYLRVGRGGQTGHLVKRGQRISGAPEFLYAIVDVAAAIDVRDQRKEKPPARLKVKVRGLPRNPSRARDLFHSDAIGPVLLEKTTRCHEQPIPGRFCIT